MLTIQTILAPVDFSEKSDAAAAHAASLARRFDAELVLIHVRPIEYRPELTPGAHAQHEMSALQDSQRYERKLEGLRRELMPEGRSTGIFANGEPGALIAKTAKSREAGLIVMATHGYGVFRRMLLGSVTLKVLHDAQCPVLTGVHLEEAKPFEDGNYRKIACAVGLDDPEHSRKVLRWTAELAETFGSTITVIHAAPPSELVAWEGLPVEFPEKVERERRGQVMDLLNELGLEADVHVELEPPVKYVRSVLAETCCDLLVTGRSVRHGLIDRPHADAYALVRESPVPVISV